MGWTNPTNPITGTVITVAYAATNILDNLRHLRTLLGGADPPGSNYVPVSTSTSAVSWQKVPVDALAAGAAVASLGYTPANKAGDRITGDVTLPYQIALKGENASGVARNLIYRGADERAYVGDANTDVTLVGGALPRYQQGASSYKLWHEGNDGSGSGLDADLLDGQEASAFAAVGHTHPAGESFPTTGIVMFRATNEIPAGWVRESNLDGRLPVGAGTTFGQTFTQGVNYGSSWGHTHDSNTFTVSASGTGSGSTGATAQESSPVTRLQVSGTGSDPNYFHHHDGVSVSVNVTGSATGNTSSTTFLPPMRAYVYARAS